MVYPLFTCITLCDTKDCAYVRDEFADVFGGEGEDGVEGEVGGGGGDECVEEGGGGENGFEEGGVFGVEVGEVGVGGEEGEEFFVVCLHG